jgi:hypothetical protein
VDDSDPCRRLDLLFFFFLPCFWISRSSLLATHLYVSSLSSIKHIESFAKTWPLGEHGCAPVTGQAPLSPKSTFPHLLLSGAFGSRQ